MTTLYNRMTTMLLVAGIVLSLFSGCPPTDVPDDPVPTAEITAEATVAPTADPTVEPSGGPTADPTPYVDPTPTEEPTGAPTPEITPVPTADPTPVVTPVPTADPTAVPTPDPTPEPTPVAPSNLKAVANSPTSISLTWTDNANNETGFEIQRETTIGGWATVTTTAANAVSYTQSGLAETWPGYRIRAVNGGGTSTYTATAYAPAKLRIINDLYSSIATSGNDWSKLNNLVRIRIATTESLVLNDTTNTYERLCPIDGLSPANFTTYADWIAPAYNQTTQYQDFPVSTYGIGANYWIYLQCGWWEYDAFGDWWNKRVSSVLCTNGTCCCYKWATVNITGHTSGYFVLRASQYLQQGSWNGTL